jgi:hypothetical protein
VLLHYSGKKIDSTRVFALAHTFVNIFSNTNDQFFMVFAAASSCEVISSNDLTTLLVLGLTVWMDMYGEAGKILA